jgi:hypothetical protein
MKPTKPCRCFPGAEIVYCPLHGAAPKLLKVCKEALDMLECAVEAGGGDPRTHYGCSNLRAIIAEAGEKS